MGLITAGLQNSKRYQEIVQVLIKHGFGFLVKQLHLSGLLPLKEKIAGYPVSKEIKISHPERARLVLEDLGPTFIKAGQILSTRPDLIPYSYVKEFEKLTDKAPPFEFEKVKEIIEEDYGKSLKEVFKSFNKKPLAAASLGQVHKATLKNGQKVVVKIQRPGVKQTIDQDIRIIKSIARLAEKHISGIRRYRPTKIVDEYKRTVRQELNYRREARNINKFQKSFKDNKKVRIPKVFWDHTSDKVLVIEFLEGKKITKWLDENLSKKKRRKIAKRIVRIFLDQIFKYGIFQADPHSGNILVMEDEVVGLIDFGMVGYISDSLKSKLRGIFAGVFQKNSEKIAKELLNVGVVSPRTNVEAFKRDVSETIEQYYGTSLGQVKLEEIIRDLNSILVHYQIRIPQNFTLLMKTIAVVEGIVRQVDESYEFTSDAKKYVEKMVKEKFKPEFLWEASVKRFIDTAELMAQLPYRVDKILSLVERGVISIEFQHQGLDKLSNNINKAGNTLAFSLVVAAFIISSSLIINAQIGPLFWGFPVLGLLVFVITALIGIWWMIKSIYR